MNRNTDIVATVIKFLTVILLLIIIFVNSMVIKVFYDMKQSEHVLLSLFM